MTDPTTPTPPDQDVALPAAPQPSLPHVVEAQPGTEMPQPPSKRRRYLLIGAAVVAILLAAGAAIAFGSRPSRLEVAREKCGAASDDYAKLGDDGSTLTLHSVGKESSGLSFDQLECYWSELEMPDSVRAEVGATRALDGRQSGQWDDIHASWSYHPDSGVQMVFTLAD
ncbi:hypothetical protein Q2K19_25490 [Micromonospora soli]|uniref:hypothetical protein n=1 Tax=Micromonospora sp. NBRC 110009 TaxID=3061627 RepID=UPI002671A2C6|nr:hypothetical protein [Micromonospora sp. NBRC 110009]WKT97506.1 hypothetical protein Q2K19_25490 [Micromonospora sp. NBRC 110009]